MDEEERLKKILLKKAMGYGVKEETIEYVRSEDGDEVIAKRKVSKKHIPPDISALRLLIEHFYCQAFKDIESMSDEELEKERERILKLLKEEEQNEIKKDDDT